MLLHGLRCAVTSKAVYAALYEVMNEVVSALCVASC